MISFENLYLAGSLKGDSCDKVEALSKTHKALGKTLYENIENSEMGSYLDFLVTPNKNVTKIKRKRKRTRFNRDLSEVDLSKI